MDPDKPLKIEKNHFTWCGHMGLGTRCYVKQKFNTTTAIFLSTFFKLVIFGTSFFTIVQPSCTLKTPNETFSNLPKLKNLDNLKKLLWCPISA